MTWIVLIAYLFALIGGFMFGYKVMEYVWKLAVKIAQKWAGRRSASPSPSGSPVLIITTFRVTPDRPEDPYMQRAKAEINKLTEGA